MCEFGILWDKFVCRLKKNVNIQKDLSEDMSFGKAFKVAQGHGIGRY